MYKDFEKEDLRDSAAKEQTPLARSLDETIQYIDLTDEQIETYCKKFDDPKRQNRISLDKELIKSQIKKLHKKYADYLYRNGPILGKEWNTSLTKMYKTIGFELALFIL